MKRFILKYKASIILLVCFFALAVVLATVLHNGFYLFNFAYIGIALSVGLALYVNKVRHARVFVEFAVGLYLLVGLGLIEHENMQIEGFWYFLFLGVFSGATIHYAAAKIFGPFLFGRGWCGYACWTAMVLDVLPFKLPQERRKPYGWIRLAVLICSFLLVVILMALQVPDLGSFMFLLFIAGNLLYYAVGITLAFVCKDNRAFCKYACPVAIVMKPGAYCSALRIKCDESLCIDCGQCLKACPMEVDMLDPSRNRKGATECILCLNCIDACPTGALKL